MSAEKDTKNLEEIFSEKTKVELEAKFKRIKLKEGDLLVFPIQYAPHAEVVLDMLKKLVGEDTHIGVVFGDVKKLSKEQVKKLQSDQKPRIIKNKLNG